MQPAGGRPSLLARLPARPFSGLEKQPEIPFARGSAPHHAHESALIASAICHIRPVHRPETSLRAWSAAMHNTLPIGPQHSALAARGLSKCFDRPAVDALDLTIHAGEFYALVGPNGAGKTTTLRMVAGLLPPDAGSVTIFGVDALADPIAAKQMTAWVSDEPMIYDRLTPLEYLEFVAGLWGITEAAVAGRAEELLDGLALGVHRHQRCEGFSKGMRQKVALAGALIHDPRLIILDEPLTGLDAISARHVKRLLTERVASGATVIMTTHILEVAERMADRIGVIAAGRLVAEGTMDELRAGDGHANTSLEDLFIALVDPEAAS